MSSGTGNEGWSSWWSTIKATGDKLNEQVNQAVASIPINDEIKAKISEWGAVAGNYLDEADKKLERMEQSALQSIHEVSDDVKKLFNEVVVLEEQGQQQNGEVLFSNDRIATSRFEAALHKVHTSPQLFVKSNQLTGEVDSHTEQISEWLKSYPELRSLFDQLVPETVSYEQFWLRYIEIRTQLEDQDRKRKEILESQSKQSETYETTWSSESESEIEMPSLSKSEANTSAISGNASVVKDIQKEDANSDSDWE